MTGCVQAPKPLYYWGNYEQSLYISYSKPEKMSPAQLASNLEEDLSKAAGKGLKANPGLHAQLGLTYLELGRAEAAMKEFQTEKELFPESALFMDRMLEKMKGGTAK